MLMFIQKIILWSLSYFVLFFFIFLVFSCLCWDGSTSLHGKARYPYTEAARLSTQLWHKLTRARVALTVTTSQEAGHTSPELDRFRAELTVRAHQWL